MTKNLSTKAYQEAAQCLKMLAHPHRLQIIDCLEKGDLTAGELAKTCNCSASLASEQLKLLKLAGFIKVERQGKEMLYSLAEPHLKSILACVRNKFNNI